MSYDAFLDLRGLACPMPLVKTRQALMILPAGATVCTLTTDPGSRADFEAFCAASGHRLVRNERAEDVFFVTTLDGQPLDDARSERLGKALREGLADARP